MKSFGTVTVYTQAYNTKPYLEQCINSVLSQTYTDLEYILVDNGCTDGSSEILRDFADKDKRIHLIRFEENQQGFWQKLTAQYASGKYFAYIDSDDWWETDYLERLVGFAEENQLDLAITGTFQYVEINSQNIIMRKLAQPIILSQEQLARNYPSLWTFPSTCWATLMKLDLHLEADYSTALGYCYGGDTMQMLKYIEQCSRIGIDDSILYHYRIHPKSVSYQYNPNRFDANVACYEHIRHFLAIHGTFDLQKHEWLKRVHISSMVSTLGLLHQAKIDAERKIAECARIAAHPLTETVLTNSCPEQEQWFGLMREIVFSTLKEGKFSSMEDIHNILAILSPHCKNAVDAKSLHLFIREPVLLEMLLEDQRRALADHILKLIMQKQYTKQYHLGTIFCKLIPVGNPLQNTDNSHFLKCYRSICVLVLDEQYENALEEMTGIIFEGKEIYSEEKFLNLYLTLAAIVNHDSAFVFGKLQLAKLFLKQGNISDCQAIVADLEEMGLTDSEELDEIRAGLER